MKSARSEGIGLTFPTLRVPGLDTRVAIGCPVAWTQMDAEAKRRFPVPRAGLRWSNTVA